MHKLNVNELPHIPVGATKQVILAAGRIDNTRKILELIEDGELKAEVLEVVSDGPMKGNLLHLRGPSEPTSPEYLKPWAT